MARDSGKRARFGMKIPFLVDGDLVRPAFSRGHAREMFGVPTFRKDIDGQM